MGLFEGVEDLEAVVDEGVVGELVGVEDGAQGGEGGGDDETVPEFEFVMFADLRGLAHDLGSEIHHLDLGVESFHQFSDLFVRDAVSHEGEGDFVDDLGARYNAAVGLEIPDQLEGDVMFFQIVFGDGVNPDVAVDERVIFHRFPPG